jgi:ABC-type bacteriocin/lantibiotic exporter with double-glycine peptidase domain
MGFRLAGSANVFAAPAALSGQADDDYHGCTKSAVPELCRGGLSALGFTASESPTEDKLIHMLANFRKIFSLLDRAHRAKVFFIILLMIATAVAQTAGVGSIMPFLAVLADPTVIQRNEWLQAAYRILGFQTTDAFLYFIGVAAFIMFVTGSAMQALNHWVITRFAMMQQYHLSRRLMEDYLCRPYSFFLTRNSGDLSKRVLQEANQAVMGGVLPLMRLFSFVLLALMITMLLIVANPTLAVAVALGLSVGYGLIFLVSRKWLSNMGEARVQANRLRFTAAAEAFAGAKEIRLLGREFDYLERYRRPSKQMANYEANANIIEHLPQYAVEAIAFGGVLLMVLYLMSQGGIAHALPLIGLYGLAGKQLIPAFQKIFGTFTMIRFNIPTVDSILADLGRREGSVALHRVDRAMPRLFPKVQITLEGLAYRYPGTEALALDDLDLVIPANSTIGIIGSSGSGKSTLIDIILGLLEPESGRIKIDDELLTPELMRQWQSAIGYVPQHIFLSDANIAANIALGVPEEQIDHAAVEHAARLANLHDFVTAQLPEGYDTLVGERGVRLSGGQRQRIGIARALYRDPQVLLFDEATSALDNATERAVMEAIHRLAGTKTILLVAHRLSTVKPCDQIVVMHQGQIVEQGNWSDLSQHGSVFGSLQ